MEWTFLLKCDSCFIEGMGCRGKRRRMGREGGTGKGPARDHIRTSMTINTILMPTWYCMVGLLVCALQLYTGWSFALSFLE